MASHEWSLEDIINVEELDDRIHDNEAPFALNSDPLPEPNGPLTMINANPSISIDGNTSPESMNGYDLSPGLTAGASMMLPPSSYDLYQPPWSPINAMNGLGDACPRTTPASLLNNTAIRIDTSMNEVAALPYPFRGCRPDSETDNSLSYTPSESEFQLPSPSVPSMNDGSIGFWANGSSDLSYTSLGPWGQVPGGVNQSFDSNFNLSMTNSPSSWSSSSVIPSSVDLPSHPKQPMESLTGDKPCVSPSQTVNSNLAPSPASVPPRGDTWWPLPDLLLTEQDKSFTNASLPIPSYLLNSDPPRDGTQEVSLSPGSDDVDGYHLLLQHAQSKWSDVGSGDQNVRDAALLEMRGLGLSYKDIKQIGNFPDALPTLRGRHRILTTPSTERVRRPPWTPRDEQLLRDAVRVQLSKPRVRRTQRIIWKEVANHVNRNGSSYKFSYVTCSQKWQQMTENSQGLGGQGARNVRGRGAFRR